MDFDLISMACLEKWSCCYHLRLTDLPEWRRVRSTIKKRTIQKKRALRFQKLLMSSILYQKLQMSSMLYRHPNAYGHPN
uniref:Putative ovule protein n=1 Tax=Solanum chacoense TaxID=4108 RepID=A0A0V0GJN1_SOLCH